MQEAIEGHGRGKTLVFSGTVELAERTAQALRSGGVEALLYHRDMTQAEKDLVLARACSRYRIHKDSSFVGPQFTFFTWEMCC